MKRGGGGGGGGGVDNSRVLFKLFCQKITAIEFGLQA